MRSAHKGGPVRRHVPIHDEFIDELRAWWATLERAGITRRIPPYDLRHNFITLALEKGADIKALAEVFGSRPETIVRHYQHVTKMQHRKTMSKIPPLNQR
jgi:integrase/recombinase XerC